VPLVHLVATANLHVTTLPDANATPDPPASNAFAKVFGKDHWQLNWADASTASTLEQAHDHAEDSRLPIYESSNLPM
jgi:hypothetical protein